MFIKVDAALPLSGNIDPTLTSSRTRAPMTCQPPFICLLQARSTMLDEVATCVPSLVTPGLN